MGIWLCRDKMKFGWNYSDDFHTAFDHKCEERWIGNSIISKMPFGEKIDLILLSASMISLPLSRKIDFTIHSCPLTNLNRLWCFKLTKNYMKNSKQPENKFIKNYYCSSFFLFFQTKYTHLYTFHSLLSVYSISLQLKNFLLLIFHPFFFYSL